MLYNNRNSDNTLERIDMQQIQISTNVVADHKFQE